jgi:hypothetical protein
MKEAQYYRAKAQLARESAENEQSPHTKTVWHSIADDYDLTAESLESPPTPVTGPSEMVREPESGFDGSRKSKRRRG